MRTRNISFVALLLGCLCITGLARGDDSPDARLQEATLKMLESVVRTQADKIRSLEAELAAARDEILMLKKALADSPTVSHPTSRPALAADTNPWPEKWVESFRQTRSIRNAGIKSLQTRLDRDRKQLAAQRSGKTTGHSPNLPQVMDRKTKELEAARRGANSPEPIVLNENCLRVGIAGTVLGQRAVVRQVLGAKDCLAEIVIGSSWVLPSGPMERGFLTSAPGHEVASVALVHLVDLPTAGLVDGGSLDLPAIYQVCGTYQYPTATGASNTIFEVRPIDAAAWRAAFAAWIKAGEK
ncbi:MAG TPA: hypothetical protein VNA25_13485 [Phycisphaerae bacterium]|nr:hypothetical protein [Phycisphaerae bacterium]